MRIPSHRNPFSCFLILCLAPFLWAGMGAACGRDEVKEGNIQEAKPSGGTDLQMEKRVSKEASFVLYLPQGWTAEERPEPNCRTLDAADPTGAYRVSLSHGRFPAGMKGVDLAGAFIEQAARGAEGLRIENAMATKDGCRMVFDGIFEDEKKNKRVFRCWISCGEDEFLCSRMEAPQGKLEEKMPLLLTVLSNVRILKGAFKWNTSPAGPVKLKAYHLRDGSASFAIPEGWKVQELGAGNFIAQDPAGSSSFIVANVEVLTPDLGVRVPGVPVSPYLPPHKALKFLAEQQGIATGMQFQEVVPRKDLAARMQQVYTLGQVEVEDFLYTCTGRSGRAKGFSMGFTFRARLGTNWNLRHLTVAAPEDQFDAFLPRFIAMLDSYRIDEAWVKDYVARGLKRLAALQAQTASLVARNAQEIRETMQAAYEERSRSMDYIDYQRSNYIRGEQDWISEMEGGTIYHTDAWGTRNTETGEYWEGKAYDYVRFKGDNPKYHERMIPIDGRALWERRIRR